MAVSGAVRRGLFAAAVACALAGIGLLPFVMQRFGRAEVSPPSLSDAPRPEIPGELLYREADGCLVRSAASGESRERLFCGEPYARIGGGRRRFAWTRGETLAFVVDNFRFPGDGGQPYVVEIDHEMNTLAAGYRPVGTPGDAGVDDNGRLLPLSPDGESAKISADGRLLAGEPGAEQEIAGFDANGSELQFVTWSPDGKWLALAYRAADGDGKSELWLVSRDGRVRGTLAKGLGDVDVSWRIADIGVWPVVVE